MLHINCVFEGIIPKKQESIDDCQDRYCIKDNCLAIADGASQSFYPSIWAELLVKHFCDNPQLDEENWEKWLHPIQEKWRSEVTQRVEIAENERKGVWVTNKNRLLRREAATTTFIGLELTPEKLRLSVVGDSCFFIWQKHREKLDSFILRSSQDFDDRPEYFGSYPKDNKFAPKFDEINLKNLDLEDTFFFLATDALAEWILKNREQKEDIFYDLLKIDSSDKFEDAMSQARDDSEIQLKNDDTTLLIFQLSEKRTTKIKKELTLPKLPEKKSNDTSDEPHNLPQISNGSMEKEGDLSQGSEADINSNSHNIKANKIQNISSRIIGFFKDKKSTEESESSNIDQLNNEHDQTQIPDNSILPQEAICQLRKNRIYLENRIQQLIDTNKKLVLLSLILGILFASSLLGNIILSFPLWRPESSKGSLPETPEPEPLTPADSDPETPETPEPEPLTPADSDPETPEPEAQIAPGQPYEIMVGEDIYDDWNPNIVIIESVSNPIEATVQESEKNLVKVQANLFIEVDSKSTCPQCSSDEIRVKQGISIWKNPNKDQKPVGTLAEEKNFIINPNENNTDFISIQFSGYINQD